MKNPKVGERVAVYDVENDEIPHRTVGTIKGIIEDDLLEFDPGYQLARGKRWVVHPKQCRRLRPKRKAREFWLNVNSVCTYVHDSLESANKPEVALCRKELIHVREVLK